MFIIYHLRHKLVYAISDISSSSHPCQVYGVKSNSNNLLPKSATKNTTLDNLLLLLEADTVDLAKNNTPCVFDAYFYGKSGDSGRAVAEMNSRWKCATKVLLHVRIMLEHRKPLFSDYNCFTPSPKR